MSALKPSKSHFSKAIRDGRFYLGQFSMPGIVPDVVRKDGVPVRYETEDEAETAALWALTAALQKRIYDERKPGPYRRMTGAELAQMIDLIGITVTEFGVIGGWPQSRVLKWLEGEDDIPHYVRILARLLASPINLNQAQADTNEAMKGAER